MSHHMKLFGNNSTEKDKFKIWGGKDYEFWSNYRD